MKCYHKYICASLYRTLKAKQNKICDLENKLSQIQNERKNFLNEDMPLTELKHLINQPINLLILGSIDDKYKIPGNIREMFNVFSLDAMSPSEDNKVTSISQIITPRPKKVLFIERKFTATSSTLLPFEELIKAYNLTSFYEVANLLEQESTSINEISKKHQIANWHYIKTDLEGLDLSVIQSMGEGIKKTLLLQMECRFQPFFKKEPYFHEVVAYMLSKGFELLDLITERWRYHTPNKAYDNLGRAVFCDTIFVNTDPSIYASSQVLIQAMLLGLLGYVNYAEYILSIDTNHEKAKNELLKFFFSKADKKHMPQSRMPHVVRIS